MKLFCQASSQVSREAHAVKDRQRGNNNFIWLYISLQNATAYTRVSLTHDKQAWTRQNIHVLPRQQRDSESWPEK
jgi:hypothetical protein